MWAWLASLPIWSQITLPVAILFVILLISIYGKASFQWGKKTIGFGRNKGRSCNDCMVLTFSKREEFEIKIRKLENSILKNQMNFAEQRLESVLFDLIQDYRTHLKLNRSVEIDYEREHRETVLYEEILKIALGIAKDEIRRSFKENGFHELDSAEFQTYVKNKTIDLLARIRGYILNRYPTSGMIICNDEKIDINRIEAISFDIYINAKMVRVKVQKEIEELENQFVLKIQDILKGAV